MNARRLVLLVNPNAREGRTRARLMRALATRPDLSRLAEVVTVESRGAARAALRGLDARVIAVAAGGDGTVNLVAAAVWEEGAGRPMGVLPLGTGNAFAAPLGLGRLPRALDALTQGVERTIDVLVTTHPDAPVAMVSLSTGFESRVLVRAAARRTWRRGMALLGGLIRATPGHTRGIALETDGETLLTPEEAVYNVGLYNLPCYGFGWRMWPDADPSDGVAEAVVCRSAARYWRMLGRGLATARPRTEDPRSRRWRVARLESRGPIQVDGEVIAPGRFDVRVAQQALRVMAPAGSRDAARAS